MPIGASDIADLRLSRLQGLITKFTMAPSLRLMKMFPVTNSPSDKIRWESEEGVRAMAPFKAPGAKTPQSSPRGVAKHEASAAFWGEKMYMDEEFLNNLRQPGTEADLMDARTKLATELRGLSFRVDRRKEWMFAKMLTAGTFSYKEKDGIKTTVDYGIPSANQVTKTSTAKWNSTAPDILGDIRDGKARLRNTVGAEGGFMAITTETVLRYMAEDSTTRDLFRNDAFGPKAILGNSVTNIMGIRPELLSTLLDMPIMIYEERFTVEAYITAAVTADSTVAIYVDDASDFEVGQELTFHDISAGTSEDSTISAVDEQAGTVTVDTAPTSSYKAGEDVVTMTTTFLPTNLFTIFVPKVENKPIAEYKQAPFGIPRTFGKKLDQWFEREPDAVWIRAEDKGLPILKHADAVYQLTVA